MNQTNHARLHLCLTLALVVLLSAAAVMLGTASVASAQPVYPSWSQTGNLGARRGFTATLLQNGKVLVAGGFNHCSAPCVTLNSAELYDPATGTWSSTSNLNSAREFHTATLLQNGKVLVVGGDAAFSGSAELYDPATGRWTSTGKLGTARFGNTATLLPNGKVLVAGGGGGIVFALINRAELYDPDTGTWSNTGNLKKGRFGTATLLPNGKVLVAGGDNIAGDGNSAELYDPATGTWSFTGNLNTSHFGTAKLLPNGKVLVAGGGTQIGNGAELYDPVTEMWSLTGGLNYARVAHTMTLLPNGKVLVGGGVGNEGFGNVFSSAELYDPATGKWNLTAYLNTSRVQHSATLLPNGTVLVVGGYDSSNKDLNTAELFDSSASPNSNIIDDAHFYVQQHYADFLNRDADASGLGFWTNEITGCGADIQCLEIKRINVSAAFFLSIEFQGTGYFVYRVNKAAHGNLHGAPVPVTLNEFRFQTLEMGQGVIVGKPGWEQVLEFNKQAFVGEFDG